MQLKTSDIKTHKTLKDAAVSIPKSVYSSKIFDKDFEINTLYCPDSKNIIFTDMLAQQHPLISTWLILSSVSICLLTTLLFVFN